jgi:SSS family transporter
MPSGEFGILKFGILNYCVLIAYFGVMLLIGVVLARRQKSTEEFFLGGRRLPWIVVAMSMFASLVSGVSYMGLPGIAYKENVAMIIGVATAPFVAPLLILIFYPFYYRLRVTTSYEYIYRRYGAPARYAASTLFILARLCWLGVVMYTPALTLSVVMGLPVWATILIMGVLATTYTVLGGLSAAVWTDVIHFFALMTGAIFTTVVLIIDVPGGLGGIFRIADQHNHLQIFEWRSSPYELVGPVICVFYILAMMHDYGCDQVSVQRLLATNSFRSIVRATIVNSLFNIIFNALLLFVGLGLFAYYLSFPHENPGLEPDKIFPHHIMRHLPNGISGLTISAIFVAAMSCMDSAINSLVTVIVNDFIKPLRRVQRTDQEDVILARALTIFLGAVTIGMAFFVWNYGGSIVEASNTFLGLFGGPVLALFLLGMLTRRANFHGWLVGTIIAIVVTAYVLFGAEKPWHWVWTSPVAFSISFVVGYVASLILGTRAPPATTIWDQPLGETQAEKAAISARVS